MNKSAQFWLRIGIAVMAVLLILSVRAVYWPIIVSIILTFVLMPVCRFFSTHLDGMRGKHVPVDISILLSFLVFMLILWAITNSVLRPLILQLTSLTSNFNDLVYKTGRLVLEFENGQTQLYIPEQVKILIDDGIMRLGNYGADSIKGLVSTVFVLAGTVVEAFVVPIITFYFMKDGKKMARLFITLYPDEYRPQLIMVAHEAGDVLSKYIRGLLLMSCIMSILTFIGMWFMGVPYPMVLALLTGIAEWIPIVGPIAAGAPAVLLAALVSPSLAVEVFIFYAIIQQLDSVLIRPLIMGAVISIHPVAIIIALLIGAALFGITGMVLAVPVTALLQVVCKHLWFYNTFKEKAMSIYGKD